MPNELSNIEQAKQLSKDILDDLEIKNLPISQILMKTKRLARLLHDTDAQKWINYEMTGYPENFNSDELGLCKKYYCGAIKMLDMKSQQHLNCSLPCLESYIKDISVDSFSDRDKTGEVFLLTLNIRKELLVQYDKGKALIHSYVTDVNIALSIGDIANDIFQDARIIVDQFIQENCSKETKEKLLAVNERMKENNIEAYSQALLSCRRILESVSDSIFPAQSEPYIDSNGKERNVNSKNYINRILAFIDQNIKSESMSGLISTDTEHLAARLDAINNESNKGVHDSITKEEAQLTIIQMYLIIAEIARIKQNKSET